MHYEGKILFGGKSLHTVFFATVTSCVYIMGEVFISIGEHARGHLIQAWWPVLTYVGMGLRIPHRGAEYQELSWSLKPIPHHSLVANMT